MERGSQLWRPAALIASGFNASTSIAIEESAQKVSHKFIGDRRKSKRGTLNRMYAESCKIIGHSMAVDANNRTASRLLECDWAGVFKNHSQLLNQAPILASETNARSSTGDIAIRGYQSQCPSHLWGPGAKDSIIGAVSTPVSSPLSEGVGCRGRSGLQSGTQNMMTQRGWEDTQIARDAIKAFFFLPMPSVEILSGNPARWVQIFRHSEPPIRHDTTSVDIRQVGGASCQ